MKEENRGDIPCDICGTKDNPVWFTDNTLWNDVIENKGDILCVNCFVEKVEAKYEVVSWRLLPVFRKFRKLTGEELKIWRREFRE